MQYNKKTLPNGLRIITVPMTGTNTATVLVMVGAGSYNETREENGISHFLEHMAFKGTKKRPKPMEISVELDGVGGQHNAFTWHEFTGYWAKVDSKNVGLAMDIISDISINGLLGQKEIDRERGVILEEINLDEDQPRRNVVRLFGELLYGDQPAGRSVLGPKEIISKLSRKDFVKYKKEHYIAKNIVVAVAGNIDSKKIEQEITKYFKGISKNQAKDKDIVKENKNRSKVLLKYKDTSQSHFRLGGFAYKTGDKKECIAEVLFAILGQGMSSRLFSVIREKNGLAYYVGSGLGTKATTGNYAIRSGVDSNRVEKAIKLSVNELKKLKDKKVGAKELRKAKEMIKGGLAIGLESSDDVAEWVAGQELLENKILTPEEYVAKIESVTAEQIQEVANELFTDDNLKLAMIGPHKDSVKFEKLLKV
ncbi:insulinase family protein [bacterium]|nr:MAG: insulinase family protein [bacterium]